MYPAKLLSDNAPQFHTNLAHEGYRLMDIRKLATSLFQAICNGGTKRSYHTMEKMLSCVMNEHQGDWEFELPLGEFAYNN